MLVLGDEILPSDIGIASNKPLQKGSVGVSPLPSCFTVAKLFHHVAKPFHQLHQVPGSLPPVPPTALWFASKAEELERWGLRGNPVKRWRGEGMSWVKLTLEVNFMHLFFGEMTLKLDCMHLFLWWNDTETRFHASFFWWNDTETKFYSSFFCCEMTLKLNFMHLFLVKWHWN